MGAGKTDVEIFKNFKNVIFTNISKKTELNKIKKKILMQDLPYKDQEFDYVVTHASIHHSSKPHLAVLEMLRVAKIGIVFIEARDCLLTKLSCKIGLSEEYEFSAVRNNSGGVDDNKSGHPLDIIKYHQLSLDIMWTSFGYHSLVG